MNSIRTFICLWTALLTTALIAQAGVLLVEASETLQGDGEPQTSKIRIDAKRVRVESGSGGEQQIFIYDAGRETIWMINPSQRTYREMTKQDLQQMMGQVSDQMAQMRKMMEERLKNMPPEQRQMVEQMMKQRMGAMPGAPSQQPAKTVYQKVGSEACGQWNCTKYEGTRNGEKRNEILTTEWSELGLTRDDFAILQELGGFFRGLVPDRADEYFQVGSAEADREQGYEGVPIRRTSFRDGRPDRKSEITEVSRQEFEDALFAPPEGYQKEEVPRIPRMNPPR